MYSFWSERFWLPTGWTWEDFNSIDGFPTRNPNDLLIWPFVIMIFLQILKRAIVIPLVFAPFGRYMGMRSQPISPPPPNAELEKLYKVNRARPPPNLLERCAKEINMTERKVERWLRRKALSQQKTTLEKFSDYGWEFTYYTSYLIFGLLVVATQPWCYELELTLENFPRTPISQGIWWYYMIGFGFYLGQTYTLFSETKRFDFYLMLLHHCCTICMIISSWQLNLIRLGAITLLVHECADITLAFGKLIYYCGLPQTANLMGIPFCLVWFPTRLGIFPFHVMRGCLFVAPRVIGKVSPSYYLLSSLMVTLLGMHVVWSFEIVRGVVRKLKSGVHLNDRFSPDEMSEEEDQHKNEILHTNGIMTRNKMLTENGTLTNNRHLPQNRTQSHNGIPPLNGT